MLRWGAGCGSRGVGLARCLLCWSFRSVLRGRVPPEGDQCVVVALRLSVGSGSGRASQRARRVPVKQAFSIALPGYAAAVTPRAVKR